MQQYEQTDSIWWIDKLIWIGVGFSLFYWFVESALHVFVFRDGNFASQIFINDFHELWKRLLIGSLIIAFSYYAQQKLNERKQAEAAIKVSEKRYRTIFEDALNPIFLFGEAGPLIECNQAAFDFLECQQADLSGKTLVDLCSQPPLANSITGYSPSGDYRNLETHFLVNGRTKTLLLNLVPLTDADQTLVYGIGQDISERKQMEREITMAHSELNHIFQTASVGMRLIDGDFTILKVNETFAALSGTDAAETVGKKCYDVFAGPMCHRPECPLTLILKGEKDIEYEIVKQRMDGVKVPCILSARPFLGPEGDLVGIVESFKDIGELKRAQEELRTERDKLHRILFQRYEGVGIVNRDCIIEYQNETLRGQIGDCEGKPCYQALLERRTPCKTCLMEEAIALGNPRRTEFDASSDRSYELTYTPYAEPGGENKVIINLRDITEIRASRAAAIQSEQLAALGALAAGVAHEINNPINGIINYGQILTRKCDQKDAVKSIAERIVLEGDRIARIVESLLSFTRREKQLKTPTAINRLIEDTMGLTGAQMRTNAIDVRVDIPANLPPVVVVPQKIQQVFLNILNNAQYSLNAKYSGTRESKIIEISARSIKSNGNRRVNICFYDNGEGIPAKLLDKVVNPFFSTKPRGKGTGLGLSISHGIINDHGGTLAIKSVEGEYTKVDIELPVQTASKELRRSM